RPGRRPELLPVRRREEQSPTGPVGVDEEDAAVPDREGDHATVRRPARVLCALGVRDDDRLATLGDRPQPARERMRAVAVVADEDDRARRADSCPAADRADRRGRRAQGKDQQGGGGERDSAVTAVAHHPYLHARARRSSRTRWWAWRTGAPGS